jgi:hypothetical protein
MELSSSITNKFSSGTLTAVKLQAMGCGLAVIVLILEKLILIKWRVKNKIKMLNSMHPPEEYFLF